MTNSNEDLILDTDGIPILTDLVHEDDIPSTAEPQELQEPRKIEVSVEELTTLLLNSDSFTQQLDEIATELTRSVRQEIEKTIRPILEEAITLAFDDSSTASCEAARKKLEAALPDLIVRTLQD